MKRGSASRDTLRGLVSDMELTDRCWVYESSLDNAFESFRCSDEAEIKESRRAAHSRKLLTPTKSLSVLGKAGYGSHGLPAGARATKYNVKYKVVSRHVDEDIMEIVRKKEEAAMKPYLLKAKVLLKSYVPEEERVDPYWPKMPPLPPVPKAESDVEMERRSKQKAAVVKPGKLRPNARERIEMKLTVARDRQRRVEEFMKVRMKGGSRHGKRSQGQKTNEKTTSEEKKAA